MGINVLPLDDETRAKFRELAERAALRENWYRVGEAAVPGDSAKFHLVLNGAKHVFTWTVAKTPNGKWVVARHLSVSCRDGQSIPDPVHVFTVARWLGFTSVEADKYGIVHKPGPKWQIDINHIDHCVVIVEIIDGVVP